MHEPTLGSLFSGCGGLDLGLERGADLVTRWQCQYDPDSKREQPCNGILERHWPGVPNLGDITAVDWGSVEPVDVLAGGFPCQDLSYAGRGAGIADGTRSRLWFEFAHAIRALRPRVVLVENVPGLITRGLGVVLADLAEAGYDASWGSIRAADVGAPHRRERVFVVAADAERITERRPQPGEVSCASRAGEGEGPERERLRADAGDGGGAPSDAERLRVNTDRRLRGGGQGEHAGPARASVPAGTEVACATDAVADRADAAADTGRVAGPQAGELDGGPGAGCVAEACGDEGEAVGGVAGCDSGGSEALADAGSDGGLVRLETLDSPDAGVDVEPGDDVDRRRVGGAGTHDGHDGEAAAHADGEHAEPRLGRRAPGGVDARAGTQEHDGDGHMGTPEQGPIEWGVYENAVRQWEDIFGYLAPRPTDDRGRLAPEFVEWMLGYPAGWTAGVSRTARLKMLGNSVQVQVAEVVAVAVAISLDATA